MAQIVKVLNSVAALGADCTAINYNLSVAGVQIPSKGIRGSSVTPYAAGTLSIWTITPTSANSTFFSVSVQGLSSLDNRIKLWTASFTSATSATATTICNQIRAAFRNYNDFPYTLNADANATVTITGIISNNIFTVAAGVDSVGAFASITNGTAAVQAYGGGALLIAGNIQPLAGDTQFISTNNYTTVVINYIDEIGVETRNSVHQALNQLYVFVNQGDTDYTTLVGTSGTLTIAATGKNVSAAVAMTTSSTLAYTQATGVLTMTGGTGTFANQLIMVNDILSIDSAPTVPLPVLLETTNLLGVSTIGLNGAADISAGAYHIIHVTN